MNNFKRILIASVSALHCASMVACMPEDVEETTTATTVANGEVTAIKAGTATITVKTEDGNKTATCTVTVKKKKIDTEKDNGGLNFGKGGGAGDNIDEEEDIFDGGSF